MKVIEVQRGEIPQDWTDEHVRVLTHGHERGVVSEGGRWPRTEGARVRIALRSGRHRVRWPHVR